MVGYLFHESAFNNIGNKGVKILIKADLPMLNKLSLSNCSNMKHRTILAMKELSTWWRATGKCFSNSDCVNILLQRGQWNKNSENSNIRVRALAKISPVRISRTNCYKHVDKIYSRIAGMFRLDECTSLIQRLDGKNK